MSDVISWDSVMSGALSMPYVKVDRDSYLREQFGSYGSVDKLATNRPIDIYSIDVVKKAAEDAISYHTKIATTTSAVAGMPGGFAMLGTIPADLVQYYWHVLVLAQKLGYIYGWPNLLDKNGNVDDGTKNILTLFVGVMLGAQAANKAVSKVAERLAVQVTKRLPQQALTKTAIYPIVKKVATWIGIKLTKESFAKGVSKVIPILGGIISGGLTYATFKPMANKLSNELEKQMTLVNSLNGHYMFDDAEEAQIISDDFEFVTIQACINIAIVDFDLANSEVEFLTDMINSSSLDMEKKNLLLEQLHNKKIVDLDFDKFKSDDAYATALMENLIAVVRVDNIVKPEEKVYLYKVAYDLGISKEDIDCMIKNIN